MKSIDPQITVARLRARLLALVLLGLLPLSGLVIGTALTSQHKALTDAGETLLATALLAAPGQEKAAGAAARQPDVRLPADVALVVIGHDGTVTGAGAGGTPQVELPGTKVRDTALLDALKTLPPTAFEGIDPDGVPRIYAAVAVGGNTRSGPYVVASMPRAAVTSSAHRQLARSAALALALAAFGLLLAGWAGEKIILAPVRRLLDQARERAGTEVDSPDDPAKSTHAFVEPSRAFHRMADTLPQIVWMMQADGQHTYFNQGWIDYSGLAMDESLGHGWTRLIHPEDSQPVSAHREQAFGRGDVYEIEHRIRRADGVYRWMLSRALPLSDANGQKAQWLGTFTDIDDLKQATALQEKSLSIIRIAGKVAHLGGWTIELPEHTLTWSDENCAIHDVPPGYQPTLEEGIGYFLPEHRATVTRYVEACAQHGTPYEFVLPKITAKGRRIWVRSIGEAVRDASGQIIRLQGAFQDISEQKAAEQRMLALEARLVTTLETITDGFCLLDKDWNFAFVNGPAEGMLQRRREDILGKNVWLEFPETVGTAMERAYRKAVVEQRTVHFETFYPPLNTWFDLHVYPSDAGIAVYFQDVTQRRSDQAQLRLLETAVSRLNDMVIITNATPFDEQVPQIVFVNDAFERYTGYRREEAIGHTPKLLLGPKSQCADLERIRAAMKNWQPVRAEVISYTKAGKELWLEIDITPIADETGVFTHWVSVQRDITERRRQQEEIISLNSELEERVQLRTSQMKVANTELASFSYSVSHDLRSPLNTIHAFSHLLIKAEGDHLSPKGQHYLSRIIAAAKQMGELIEGLLTLAHLSREQFKSEPVDLSAIARRIARDCHEREPERQTQAQVHIHDGLRVHGDPRLLSAVLQNLVGNAWKFTSMQPLARIEVGSEVDAHGDSHFFVRDNGAGFDMAFAHKLFGTFERLHSPEEFSGSGIGLATVKRIIERHGGRVWAESRLNEGATFYFTLGRMIESVT